jgi:hypothetical protein
MRVELEEQNVMLEEINQEADETDGMLKGANKQITELLKHASSTLWFPALGQDGSLLTGFFFPLSRRGWPHVGYGHSWSYLASCHFHGIVILEQP